ncbi:hypothetical protein [Enterobacter asburiae]|uniref:hypothetical protein n=1 Tax=Enterobacter asburiae TaxID=61645 RepID=UPI00192CCF65|nr:hypothetical protein [Enterobacter asburiae]MBL5924158.1 hypothetical protein [Enterobacter asburiae]MBL5954946.1 hypothetical protein [Enterobacter asburiae]
MNLPDKITATTNIISSIANTAMALAAVYAAIKAKNFFKAKFQEVIFEECAKLTETFKEIESHKFIFSLAFPFRLAEPVNQWSDHPDFMKKVKGAVEWSIMFQDCLKKAFNDIQTASSTIQLHNGKINKKAQHQIDELLELLYHIYSLMDDYHYCTIKLFKIDIERSFASEYMFHDLESIDFHTKYETLDKHLAYKAGNIKDLYERIFLKILQLKEIYASGKLAK